MTPTDAEERLHRVGRSVDRLRRMVESGADPTALLRASSSARSELLAARRALRIERATRCLPAALGEGEAGRRRARAVYSFTPLHRTLWPLTRTLRSSRGSGGRHPADANAGDRAPAT